MVAPPKKKRSAAATDAPPAKATAVAKPAIKKAADKTPAIKKAAAIKKNTPGKTATAKPASKKKAAVKPTSAKVPAAKVATAKPAAAKPAAAKPAKVAKRAIKAPAAIAAAKPSHGMDDDDVVVIPTDDTSNATESKKISAKPVVKPSAQKSVAKADEGLPRHRPIDSARRHCQYVVADGALQHAEDVRLDVGPFEAYDARLVGERTRANQHMGQRKLLLSEVRLLTTHYASESKHPLVVYVGAAPGSHDLFLHRLFPHARFILYDGARFDDRLRGLPHVFEIRNEYFTDAHCAELLRRTAPDAPGPHAGRPLLFVCDMRSDARDDAQFEAQVMRDMASQKRWVEALRPAWSLLKFRLPYTLKAGDRVPYLKGRLIWGVWPTQDSGETRLIVRRADIGEEHAYDFSAYEGAKTFHNHYTRRVCFADQVPRELAPLVFGPRNLYCSCFDCLSELVTYKRYLEEAHVAAFSPEGHKVAAHAHAHAAIGSVEEIVRLYAGHAGHAGHAGRHAGHGREPEFPMAAGRPPPPLDMPPPQEIDKTAWSAFGSPLVWGHPPA